MKLDPEQVLMVMNSLNRDFEIQEGVVNVYGSVNAYHDKHFMPVIPFPFGSVDGYFAVQHCSLASLKNSPSTVLHMFNCSSNKLTSLAEGPNVVLGEYIAYDNDIKTLHNIHHQIKRIDGPLVLHDNPLESNILGLFFIENLKEIIIDNNEVANIVNKHLQSPNRDVHACQEELIKSGFADFAKL